MSRNVRLRSARFIADLSAAQLGDAIGAHAQTITNWEKGITSPTLDQLRAIAKACGVTTEYLVGETDAA